MYQNIRRTAGTITLVALAIISFSCWCWAGPPGPPNLAPTISGAPTTSYTVGTLYSFTPAANDPEGSPLTFSINNKPDWADFDSTTGTLSGTPQTAATYGSITISVSDGNLSASLDPFSITVTASGPGGGDGSGSGATRVPVFNGIWLLLGLFAGLGLILYGKFYENAPWQRRKDR